MLTCLTAHCIEKQENIKFFMLEIWAYMEFLGEKVHFEGKQLCYFLVLSSISLGDSS